MGMYDTIRFDSAIPCSVCQAEIDSTQTKAFDCTLATYRVGDCVAHAEEIRVVREGLYCHACRKFDKQFIFLAVYRGILVGVVDDMAAAEALLRTFSFEKLLLWYHDLFARLEGERRERWAVERFLHDVATWYEKGYDLMSEEERKKQWVVFLSAREVLEKSAGPVEAIRAYLNEHPRAEEEPW